MGASEILRFTSRAVSDDGLHCLQTADCRLCSWTVAQRDRSLLSPWPRVSAAPWPPIGLLAHAVYIRNPCGRETGLFATENIDDIAHCEPCARLCSCIWKRLCLERRSFSVWMHRMLPHNKQRAGTFVDCCAGHKFSPHFVFF